MSSSLEAFAGLLDRSVQEIASLSTDARAVDLRRISRIADIWDNNTFPLVRVACAPRSVRAEWAQAGLLWMADLGAARRQLLVELDPALDAVLPAARPEPPAYRDYRGHVRPGSVPMAAQIVSGLEADYDLSAASLRSLEVRPTTVGLCARLKLAAPRRFVPSTERVARDGTREPWPPALLAFTFTNVSEVTFDADDRTGAAIASTALGVSLAIGGGGHLRAASATVWPDDPCWHESAAGRAADAVTPHDREVWPELVSTSTLAGQERAAAQALHYVMLRIRMAGYHPKLAGRIPVRELCDATAGAGTAILRAGARRGPVRRFAFAHLAQQWEHVPLDASPAPVPGGRLSLRYVRYTEPHRAFDIDRPGEAVLAAATPDTDPAAPWRLASEEIKEPARFRITAAAFDGISDFRRDGGQLTFGDSLVIHQQR